MNDPNTKNNNLGKSINNQIQSVTNGYKDTKYSWLVCVVSFISSFMTIGYTYAIGIYFVLFQDVFDTSAGTTAWVSALNCGTLTCTGN